METNEISFPMPFFLDRKSIPSVQEVVDSLQGFDAIVKRFPKILPALMDVPVSSVSVGVNKIEIGSLYEDIVVKVVFGGQEQMDLFLKDIHEKFMNHKAVMYLAFFALISFGGYTVYDILRPEDAPVSPVINSNNTTIINMISADVGKDADAVREIIERAIPHSDSIRLAKDSYKIFNAFGDSSAFKFNDFQDYNFPKEVVDAFPKNIDIDAVDELKDFEKVDVQIRAADLDSVKSGWAAKVPAVSDHRIKVKVADGVDVTKVQIGANVKADITVVYKSKEGELVPGYCIIRKIH